MKLSKLRVSIDLSNFAWIEMGENQDEKRYTCGGGDLEENFDQNKLSEALDKLKEAILE